MTNTILRILVVVFALGFAWTASMWNKQDSINRKQTIVIDNLNHNMDSLSHLSDSLYDENFTNQITVGRYEITLEYLKEVNPKAAKQFEDYLSTNTE